MSKQDGYVYIVVYEVGKYCFHEDYLYRTEKGAIDRVQTMKSNYHYKKNVRVIKVSSTGEEQELIEVEGKLIPVTEEARLLYD